MSWRHSDAPQHIPVGGGYRNKTQYNQYRTCLSYLLYNLHHDSVSGWLLLASFYYRIKHYNTALNIVSYAVSKCTTETKYILNRTYIANNDICPSLANGR